MVAHVLHEAGLDDGSQDVRLRQRRGRPGIGRCSPALIVTSRGDRHGGRDITALPWILLLVARVGRHAAARAANHRQPDERDSPSWHVPP